MKSGSNFSRIREPRSWRAKIAWPIATAHRKKSAELWLHDFGKFCTELAAPGRRATIWWRTLQGCNCSIVRLRTLLENCERR